MYRYRKNQKSYHTVTDASQQGCPFCNLDDPKLNIRPRRYHKTTKYMAIIDNSAGFDVWEMREVADHLLLVPKRHATSLADLTPAERTDYLNVLAEYEASGYNFYSRSVDSVVRSLPHLHTHLIKIHPKQAKAFIWLKKPYTLIKL